MLYTSYYTSTIIRDKIQRAGNEIKKKERSKRGGKEKEKRER
jgi:hypothetical protein